MLGGEISIGDICHDRMHSRMLEAQFCDEFGCRWNIFARPSQEAIDLRERLHAAVRDDSRLGRVMKGHVRAVFRAFSNQHPCKALAFYFWVGFWVLFLAGSLIAIWAALKAMIGWSRIKAVAAEWFVSLHYAPARPWPKIHSAPPA